VSAIYFKKTFQYKILVIKNISLCPQWNYTNEKILTKMAKSAIFTYVYHVPQLKIPIKSKSFSPFAILYKPFSSHPDLHSWFPFSSEDEAIKIHHFSVEKVGSSTFIITYS
jgi:hypothetical protein